MAQQSRSKLRVHKRPSAKSKESKRASNTRVRKRRNKVYYQKGCITRREREISSRKLFILKRRKSRSMKATRCSRPGRSLSSRKRIATERKRLSSRETSADSSAREAMRSPGRSRSRIGVKKESYSTKKSHHTVSNNSVGWKTNKSPERGLSRRRSGRKRKARDLSKGGVREPKRIRKYSRSESSGLSGSLRRRKLEQKTGQAKSRKPRNGKNSGADLNGYLRKRQEG